MYDEDELLMVAAVDYFRDSLTKIFIFHSLALFNAAGGVLPYFMRCTLSMAKRQSVPFITNGCNFTTWNRLIQICHAAIFKQHATLRP